MFAGIYKRFDRLGQYQEDADDGADRGPRARGARRTPHAGAAADGDADPEQSRGAVGPGAVRRPAGHAARRSADLPRGVLRRGRSPARAGAGGRAAQPPAQSCCSARCAARRRSSWRSRSSAAQARLFEYTMSAGREGALRRRHAVSAGAGHPRVPGQPSAAAAARLSPPHGIVDARAGGEPATAWPSGCGRMLERTPEAGEATSDAGGAARRSRRGRRRFRRSGVAERRPAAAPSPAAIKAELARVEGYIERATSAGRRGQQVPRAAAGAALRHASARERAAASWSSSRSRSSRRTICASA